MQHSPSRATDPESPRVDRDLELRERLREDIRGHVFSGTVLDVHGFVFDGLANKMESYVDVFGACVVVVVGCEVDSCLVIAERGGGIGCDVEEGLCKATKPDTLLCCVSSGDVFGFCGG